MKPLTRTFRKRIAWLFVPFAFVQSMVFGGEANESHSFAASRLVDQISAKFPSMARRNTNGVLSRLSIPSEYKNDRSLQLISEIRSIRELTIYGSAFSNVPPLTPVGIGYLERMSNLVSLHFTCFVKGGLDAGVLQAASRIRQLQEL